MKKIFFLLAGILLAVLMIVAYILVDDNQEITNQDSANPYEVASDVQLPMNAFLDNIPKEYAALKEPLAGAFGMREKAISQELGNQNVQIGFRKRTYRYPSTDVKGNPITLSSAAFWLGYFADGVWSNLSPENICLMEHYTITSDAETPSNAFLRRQTAHLDHIARS